MLFAYAPSPTVELLPRALHAFQNEAPQVKVTLHDLSSEEMLRALGERSLDVALMMRPGAGGLHGLSFEELDRFPIQVAFSPRHPLLARTRKGIAIGQLAGERLHIFSRADYPEYRDWLEKLLASFGQPLPAMDEHDSATSLIAAVETGRGVAVVPSCLACLAAARLRFVSLRPAPEPHVVGVAYLTGKLSAAATRFVAVLRQLRRLE